VNNINLTIDKHTKNVGYLKLLIYLSIMKLIDVTSFDEINKNKENINDLLEINYKYVAKNAKLSNDFLNFLIDVEVLLILAINQDFESLKKQNDGSYLYIKFLNHGIINQFIGQSIKSRFDASSENNSFKTSFIKMVDFLDKTNFFLNLSKNKICNKIDMFYNND